MHVIAILAIVLVLPLVIAVASAIERGEAPTPIEAAPGKMELAQGPRQGAAPLPGRPVRTPPPRPTSTPHRR